MKGMIKSEGRGTEIANKNKEDGKRKEDRAPPGYEMVCIIIAY